MSEVKVWCPTCRGSGLREALGGALSNCRDCEGKGYTVKTLYTEEELLNTVRKHLRTAKRVAWDEGYDAVFAANPYNDEDE